ncbi:hypothetical protein [Paraburkholderia youngii]|uniref:hypothetical protein n=1 Tax=Paraburkholderia youngii TaxID=2782701 RepID=UPI003D250194
MLVYIDHNIITLMVVERSTHPLGTEYRAIHDLLANGRTTVALSAVSLYEIARSEIEAHVVNSITLLNELLPQWLSNPIYVQTEELKRYIARRCHRPVTRPLDPLNSTMAQLWSTYGAQNVVIGETVADCLTTWHRERAAQRLVEEAARETPNAIMTGRRALAEGFVADNELIIDAEYYRARLPARSELPEQISPRRYGELPNLLAGEGRLVRKSCPAIKAEDLCQRYRIEAGFRPEPQDALDLQHVMVAMAYCDYFVTRDNDIRAMFQYVRSRWKHCPCVAVRSCTDLVDIEAATERQNAQR